MRDVFNSYIKLVPYIYGEGNVNSKHVSKTLEELEAAIKKSKYNSILKLPTFYPSMEVLLESMSDIRTTHKKGNHSFVKYRLKKIVSTCISCHSQLPQKVYPPVEHNYKLYLKKYVKSNYDKASMAFFLRDYKKGLNHLKEELDETYAYPSKDIYRTKVAQEILKTYLMNLDSPKGAQKFLEDLVKGEDTPRNIKLLSKSWLLDLTNITKGRKHLISEKQLNSLISKHLNPIESEIKKSEVSMNAVPVFYMQGLMTKFIIKNRKSSLVPKVLYWIGLIENQTNSLYLYSLGDLYLKRCMIDYKKSPWSKKCYKAYEESIYFGFTGSSGTNIPSDVLIELETLKKSVQSK